MLFSNEINKCQLTILSVFIVLIFYCEDIQAVDEINSNYTNISLIVRAKNNILNENTIELIANNAEPFYLNVKSMVEFDRRKRELCGIQSKKYDELVMAVNNNDFHNKIESEETITLPACVFIGSELSYRIKKNDTLTNIAKANVGSVGPRIIKGIQHASKFNSTDKIFPGDTAIIPFSSEPVLLRMNSVNKLLSKKLISEIKNDKSLMLISNNFDFQGECNTKCVTSINPSP